MGGRADIFDWLRSVTKLPLHIKGVLRKEEARKAVAIGLGGIIVSNHGGRRLTRACYGFSPARLPGTQGSI